MSGASERFQDVLSRLESGEIRAAEKKDGEWIVNVSVKETILEGFRLGTLSDMSEGRFSFFDKDTYPVKKFTLADKVRIVPGGSSVRRGAYLAPSVIVMPPSFVNVGAYVDEGTMIDSHALVGSCAQIGKNVHIAAAAQIGGVLEPAGALPVIVEDNVFIGGNCGIYEGVVLEKNCVLGTGVILNKSIPIFDAVNDRWIKADAKGRVTVPEAAVVVAGSRPLKRDAALRAGVQIYCPVIVKYRDAGTSASVSLEDALR